MANTQTKSVEELLQDPNYNGFYRYERIMADLTEALKATREQKGMSIRDIANGIKRVLDKAEIEALIKSLK